MSKRHQSSRRRAYGRRQHELHERDDRRWAVLRGFEDDADEEREQASGRFPLDAFGGGRLAFGTGR